MSFSSGMRSSALKSPTGKLGLLYQSVTLRRQARPSPRATRFEGLLKDSRVAHFKPSFLYPAASAYQLAKGVIQRFSHGRLRIKGAIDGADMLVDL